MSFLSTQNSELSSNLTKQHCLTPSTWGGRKETKTLPKSLWSTSTHTRLKKYVPITHFAHLLSLHCQGTGVHRSNEPTHHLPHWLPPSWGETQRREQGLCENGNPIYPLNTLLLLLTYRVCVPGLSVQRGLNKKSPPHTHTLTPHTSSLNLSNSTSLHPAD